MLKTVHQYEAIRDQKKKNYNIGITQNDRISWLFKNLFNSSTRRQNSTQKLNGTVSTKIGCSSSFKYTIDLLLLPFLCLWMAKMLSQMQNLYTRAQQKTSKTNNYQHKPITLEYTARTTNILWYGQCFSYYYYYYVFCLLSSLVFCPIKHHHEMHDLNLQRSTMNWLVSGWVYKHFACYSKSWISHYIECVCRQRAWGPWRRRAIRFSICDLRTRQPTNYNRTNRVEIVALGSAFFFLHIEAVAVLFHVSLHKEME